MRGNQYLSMLNEDEAFKFRFNFFRHRLADEVSEHDWFEYTNSYYESFGEFISNAFVFTTTPEGHGYWDFIRMSMRDGIKYEKGGDNVFSSLMRKVFGIEVESEESLDDVLEELNIKKQKSKMTKLNLDINPFLCTIDVSAKIDGLEERCQTSFMPSLYPYVTYAKLGDRAFRIILDYTDSLSVIVEDEDDDTECPAKIRIVK